MIAELTPREKQIARLLRDTAMSPRKIADHLGVKAQSIKSTLHSCYVKLGVRNRVELVTILTAPLDSPFRIGIEEKPWNPLDIDLD